jgi:hypothetical protein
MLGETGPVTKILWLCRTCVDCSKPHCLFGRRELPLLWRSLVNFSTCFRVFLVENFRLVCCCESLVQLSTFSCVGCLFIDFP